MKGTAGGDRQVRVMSPLIVCGGARILDHCVTAPGYECAATLRDTHRASGPPSPRRVEGGRTVWAPGRGLALRPPVPPLAEARRRTWLCSRSPSKLRRWEGKGGTSRGDARLAGAVRASLAGVFEAARSQARSSGVRPRSWRALGDAFPLARCTRTWVRPGGTGQRTRAPRVPMLSWGSTRPSGGLCARRVVADAAKLPRPRPREARRQHHRPRPEHSYRPLQLWRRPHHRRGYDLAYQRRGRA